MNIGKWLDGSNLSYFSDRIIIAEGYNWIVWLPVNSKMPDFTCFTDEAEKNEYIKERELENE